MFKNYYLFSELLNEIRPQIVGQIIDRVFTHRKDEVVVQLNNDHWLRLGVSAAQPYILLDSKRSVSQPQFTLFKALQGQKVSDAQLRPFDKHLLLTTEEARVEAIFFPPHNNVFFFDSQNTLREVFKEKTVYPHSLTEPPDQLDLRVLTATLFQECVQRFSTLSVSQWIRQCFAAVNKVMLKEILFRTAISDKEPIAQLSSQQLERLKTVLLEIAKELTAGQAILYFNKESEQVERIALMALTHLANSHKEQRFDSINRALSTFYYQKSVRQEFNKLHSTCKAALEKRLQFLQDSLERLMENANLQKRKAEAELKGNLLLTFQNEIPAGAKEVELPNIFSENQETIKIKLNPAKNAVANAQRYFNKFKNIKHDQQVLQIKMNTYRKEIEEISQLLQQLEQIKTLQRLKNFSTRLKEMRLLPDTTFEKKNIAAENLKYVFNRLILDGVWDVYIGKDGLTNDLLTFRFANKWDIWLHAQGVPGAHVIIRVPNRNQTPPAHVIEQAARIAAAHSKAKNSNTVPVMYTQVRYVSRVRKAPPGTVKVQNEKVLFVSPLKLN